MRSQQLVDEIMSAKDPVPDPLGASDTLYGKFLVQCGVRQEL